MWVPVQDEEAEPPVVGAMVTRCLGPRPNHFHCPGNSNRKKPPHRKSIAILHHMQTELIGRCIETYAKLRQVFRY